MSSRFSTMHVCVCVFACTHVVYSVFGGGFVMTAAGWGAPFATQTPRRSVTK